MEGFAAADGGRSLKSGLLALGTLIWAAPLAAQPAPDPLAPPRAPHARRPPRPYPTQDTAVPILGPSESPPQPPQPSETAPTPVVAAPTPAPVAAVAAPKDWRGVFDAIDSGNWFSAQAGIATLPRSVLTPLAKAELYTARGSPVVDLASLQALIAEAPELPQA